MPAVPQNDEATRESVTTKSSGRRSGGGGDGRAVITLTPAVATAARRMGKEMGEISTTEVVRRGLILLDLFLSLGDHEELVVRDNKTDRHDRLRFAWETF